MAIKLAHYCHPNVPSRGLLAGGASAPKFIDILSTEPGEQSPHCAGINDVAAVLKRTTAKLRAFQIFNNLECSLAWHHSVRYHGIWPLYLGDTR